LGASIECARERDVIVQQASHYYAPLLRLSGGLHEAYAKRHGFDLEVYHGTFAPREWHRYWDGWQVIQWLLNAGARWLVWVDSDALIVGNEDVRTAGGGRRGCWIGCVRHPGPPAHWNTGVMVIRNGDRVRQFFREVFRRGPGSEPWYQQAIANEMWDEPEWGEILQPLDDRWNSTIDVNWVADAQIRAWHGQPGFRGKMRGMRRWLTAQRKQMGLERLPFTESRLELLRGAGYRTIWDVERTTDAALCGVPGVGPATVDIIRRRVRELV